MDPNRFLMDVSRRIDDLDDVLRRFTNAARQLGSSAGILYSVFHLRERLAGNAYLFRNNAAKLFPCRVKYQSTVTPIFDAMHSPSQTPIAQSKTRGRENARQPTVQQVCKSLKSQNFPDQIEGLAEDLTALLDGLNDFPEFIDEALNTSISAFRADLQVRA